ncbi:FecR domain-containing protein [Thermodesulfobacteriota bacterium]
MLKRISLGIMISFITVVSAHTALAEIGQIKTLKGKAFIVRDDSKLPAKAGDLLLHSDILETGPQGSLGITFIDNSRFSIGPDTRIELKQFNFNPTTHDGEFVTDINCGTIAIISGQIAKKSHDAMKVKTPTTILGVRGTKFVVKVTD